MLTTWNIWGTNVPARHLRERGVWRGAVPGTPVETLESPVSVWGARRGLLRDWLGNAAADVIAIQESAAAPDQPGVSQARQLASTLDMSCHERGPLALVTRLPVPELDELPLPYPDQPIGGWHSALWAAVLTMQGRVRVCVVHLPLRSRWRELACSALAARAEEPLILCGDFNEPDDGIGLRHLQGAGGFTDAWDQVSPCDPGLTFPNPERRARLDRVLLRGGLRAVDAEVLGASAGPSGLYPSDHCGVRVELEMPSWRTRSAM